MNTRDLADLLQPDSNVRVRTGAVTAVSGARATVSLGGGTITGVPYLAHLAPRSGETVILLGTGRQFLIIGCPAAGTSGYQPITLASGMVAATANAYTPSFRITADNVHLSGGVARGNGNPFPSGLPGQHIATVPPGARPPGGVFVACASGVIGNDHGTSRLHIQANGSITALVASSNVTWIGLDGVTYRHR